MEEVKREGTSFIVKGHWVLLALCLVIIVFLLAALKQSRQHPSYIHPIDTRDEYPVAVLSAEPPPGILPPQKSGLIQPDPPRKSALSDEEQELVESLLGDKPPAEPPHEVVRKDAHPAGLPVAVLSQPHPQNFEPQFITKALIASCGGRLCVRVDTSEPPRGQDKDFYIIREP